MLKKFLILIVIILSISSCGSGTYNDDPETWNKVFGEDIPKEITVINSRFWKSAHFTFEFELYAKFETSRDFVEAYFIEHYKMVKTERPKLDIHFADAKPEWFVNKSFDTYDIYENEEHAAIMVLFCDTNSNTFYLHALQV